MKDRIRELLHAEPFRPFVIRMVDGRTFKIEHPEFVFASPSKVPEVIVEDQKGPLHFLSTLMVSGVDLDQRDKQKRAA